MKQKQAKRARRTDNIPTPTATKKWPGRIWDCWTDDNDSMAPDYFLVTGVNDIDLPIALVGTMSRREMSPQDATLSYMDALEAALVIAQKPEAAGQRMGKLGIHDLRDCGSLSGPGTLDVLLTLRCAPHGTVTNDVWRCKPFDRFEFARMLRQFFGLASCNSNLKLIQVSPDNGRRPVVFNLENAEVEE